MVRKIAAKAKDANPYGIVVLSMAKLKIGDRAPLFDLAGSDARNHRLEDHVGKRAVVLAWFPKAFTGG